MEVDDLIEFYFNLGLEHAMIHKHLLDDGIKISLRSVERRLSFLNLYRRKNYSNLDDVVQFIENEMKTSSCLHGYKWLWLKMLQKKFVVKQETVRISLQVLNPAAVEARKKGKLIRREYSSQGANFTWHIDGYDKLKPYGICISGAIDGFSRYIIWLHADRTNNDPEVIAGYYLKAVTELGGCPKTVRSDLGTENGVTKEIQESLRNLNSNSSRKAFLYGTSVANSRIESWWGQLRKHAAQFWMTSFKQLIDEGYFNGSALHKSVIQFTFMEMIQAELDEVVLQWNCHRIRKNKKSTSPSGKPLNIFRFPEEYGNKKQCLVEVDIQSLDDWIPRCKFLTCPCEENIYNLCEFILENKNIPKPCKTTAVEIAFDIYRLLIDEINLVM